MMFSILDNTLILRSCFIGCFDHLIGVDQISINIWEGVLA